MLIAQIGNFIHYCPLFWQLVSRELKLKYRRSVLGYLWSLLSPLLTMLVTAAVFSQLFRFEIDNFPIYLLSGQLVFSFFSESSNAAMASIVVNGELIKKVYIPKYIFPLSKVTSALINMLFSLVAIAIVMIFTGLSVSPTILLLPLACLYVFAFACGIGMMLSVVMVYFRDMLYLYGVFLTALTYFTPIFYPISILPTAIRAIVYFNPLYHYVTFFREIVLYQQIPSLLSNLICLLYAITACVLGLLLMKRYQNKFILYM